MRYTITPGKAGATNPFVVTNSSGGIVHRATSLYAAINWIVYNEIEYDPEVEAAKAVYHEVRGRVGQRLTAEYNAANAHLGDVRSYWQRHEAEEREAVS
jgi:hypothetical protein